MPNVREGREFCLMLEKGMHTVPNVKEGMVPNVREADGA